MPITNEVNDARRFQQGLHIASANGTVTFLVAVILPRENRLV
ncbi:MAG: hypothetical protein ACLURK_02430 [Bifidobacterium sp.]